MWKKCSSCNSKWDDSTTFLKDPDVRFIGMQLSLKTPNYVCLYFFDHKRCGTTIGVNTDNFLHLVKEPIPETTMTGEHECPRYCLDLKNIHECKNECHNAPFRRLAIRILSESN